MTHKKVKKFHVFRSAGCSPLRAEGLSCTLEVLYGGIEISNCNFSELPDVDL
jgi:hypothetical protein